MRLNKFLSLTLNLSRRASDDLIASGVVTLNQEIAQLGNRVEPEQDTVQVNGKKVTLTEIKPTYLLLNKPTGYLSSKVSQGGVPTVYELLPKEFQDLNLNIAGRLDKDTCGLILLTNDGDYLNKITHPGFNKQKTYTVRLNKEVTTEDLEKLKSGVQIGESRPSSFESIKVTGQSDLEVVLTEGRNRQIRRTFWELGYKVTFLKRTRLGDHKLEDLEEGQTKLVQEAGSQPS
jgi:23S rRNA pseudouridine2605 synthase